MQITKIRNSKRKKVKLVKAERKLIRKKSKVKKQEFFEKRNFVTRKKENKCREVKYEKGK